MVNYRILFLCLLCLISSNLFAADWVTNHNSRSTVRYPVVLLRGELPESSGDLTVKLGELESATVRRGTRFKSLVKLSEGENEITLSVSDSDENQTLSVTYRPQTNPYYVRMIWMTDSSGATEFATPHPDHPQDYEARLRTAATLMQTLTAERMHDIGMPRKTFRLERDENGEVVVGSNWTKSFTKTSRPPRFRWTKKPAN